MIGTQFEIKKIDSKHNKSDLGLWQVVSTNIDYGQMSVYDCARVLKNGYLSKNTRQFQWLSIFWNKVKTEI